MQNKNNDIKIVSKDYFDVYKSFFNLLEGYVSINTHLDWTTIILICLFHSFNEIFFEQELYNIYISCGELTKFTVIGNKYGSPVFTLEPVLEDGDFSVFLCG